MIQRRSLFVGGLIALCAPAIIRSGSLMPIKARKYRWSVLTHPETFNPVIFYHDGISVFHSLHLDGAAPSLGQVDYGQYRSDLTPARCRLTRPEEGTPRYVESPPWPAVRYPHSLSLTVEEADRLARNAPRLKSLLET